jgi:glycolate dehydrogenase FAD-binding subunit
MRRGRGAAPASAGLARTAGKVATTEIEDSRLAESIAHLVGVDRIRPPAAGERDAADLVVEPGHEEEVAEIVRKCEADRITLAPLGAARTLSQIRRGSPVALGVSLARMARVLAHEPDDMTITVEAGATLGAVNRVTAAHGQRLPLDPPNPDLATVGAIIGAAHSGPLRLSEGTVRDLLIGVRFVGQGGRIIHGGGRVVKNVAGYDLMKVMTGSFGTLGIVTEATFKVRPAPATHALALGAFSGRVEAFAGAQKLHDSIPLAHLEVLSPLATAALGHSASYAVAAGFAGIASEVDYQRARILEIFGQTTVFVGTWAGDLYCHLRDMPFPPDTVAARLAVAPVELARCLGRCAVEFRAHAGSGVAELWAERDAQSGAEAVARWREAAHSGRGSLRVIQAPAAVRPLVDFFDLPAAGALGLMKRLKSAFDPAGIFNPGCFVGGL